ncbi:uncharacterized protein LOC141631951 [Silene latifolia]|uniref:uncharacterized protein LOC141631951 n=1 Tax=Silene latifolia TaxID=37657 RepID=UPI003D77B37E
MWSRDNMSFMGDLVFQVTVWGCEAQVIQCKITYRSSGMSWWMSFVYGFNILVDREPLWVSLENMHHQVHGPWLECGDFNNVLGFEERIGSLVTEAEIRRFTTCVEECEIADVHAHEALYTWTNKKEEDGRRVCRIDISLVNMEWLLAFPEMTATFLPEGLFDHNPCIMALWSTPEKKNNSLKYFNMWGQDEKFIGIVEDVWRRQIDGIPMFQIVRKLKMLRKDLKELNKEAFSNVEAAARLAKIQLESIQLQMQEDMTNTHLWEQESGAANTYRQLDTARPAFLTQKAKVQWDEEGDNNTHYFHCAIKIRTMKNKVLAIQDAFDTEIKEALFSITANKSLGPDGYTSQFFRDAFEILKKINSTVITLVPKKSRPISVGDFRPIACCNVLYKCITKLICNRMAGVLPDNISDNQSAFIKRRDIVDNILICQDLVRFRGDTCSVTIILRAFATFSTASGFTMNNDKSEIYCNGMTTDVVQAIVRMSGLWKKMVATIKGWGTRKLSYAGRLVLVKSVLSQLHSYWARIFVIPKGLIQRIMNICWNYLWVGGDGYHKDPPVSWESISMDKKASGLGVVNSQV